MAISPVVQLISGWCIDNFQLLFLREAVGVCRNLMKARTAITETGRTTAAGTRNRCTDTGKPGETLQ